MIVLFGVFYAVPLVRMVATSLEGANLDLRNYGYLATEDIYASVMLITAKIALYVTATALVIGYPIAYYISRLRGSAMTLALAFVLLPLWTSVLVRNYAWFVLLS